MKKYIFIVLVLILTVGCSKEKIEFNYLEAKWTLDESLKPEIVFDRSKENDSHGVFYVDETQVKFEDFVAYLEKLEENKFSTDWRYSDTSTIKDLKEQYEKNGDILKDYYINFKMCNEELCIFIQWVNKEEYNKSNTEKPVSYSFKLETQKK